MDTIIQLNINNKNSLQCTSLLHELFLMCHLNQIESRVNNMSTKTSFKIFIYSNLLNNYKTNLNLNKNVFSNIH